MDLIPGLVVATLLFAAFVLGKQRLASKKERVVVRVEKKRRKK